MYIDWSSLIIGAIVIGIIVSFPIAYFANWLFDKRKKRKKRAGPYVVLTSGSKGMLEFEGRVWSNTAMSATMSDVIKQVLQESPHPEEKQKSDEVEQCNTSDD